jgi:zinc-binding in reverse transcriptase
MECIQHSGLTDGWESVFSCQLSIFCSNCALYLLLLCLKWYSQLVRCWVSKELWLGFYCWNLMKFVLWFRGSHSLLRVVSYNEDILTMVVFLLILCMNGYVTANSADIWWNLSISLKIKVFILLVCHNRILTRDNLHKRGWDNTLQCLFCSENESVSHLFVQCGWVKQIWFWLGQCQNYFHCWSRLDDIMQFALCLSHNLKKSFL